MREFIVASASPRRKEIFENGGYTFKIIPSDADETIGELSPEKAVIELSKRKALSVLEGNENSVVLGCDTVVALDDVILGKPKDKADAVAMLKMLSGKTHRVCTGVAVADKEKTESFVSITEVEFYSLSEKTIESYIETGEWTDKAGSYGIQGYGSVLVKSIKGDYQTVVGLPFSKCARVLSSFGIKGKIEI